MSPYDTKTIEPKWQAQWDEAGTFRATRDESRVFPGDPQRVVVRRVERRQLRPLRAVFRHVEVEGQEHAVDDTEDRY